MDCDAFKRRLMTDPMDTDPEFRGHAQHCPSCAAEAKRALAFETQLRAALAAEMGKPLPAPGGGRRHRRWLLLGLLPLLAAVIWWALRIAPDPAAGWAGQALARLAIEHVQSEPDLLDTSGRLAVPVRHASLLLHNLGVDAPAGLATAQTLRYAGRCRIGEVGGVHLVMDGRRGPVTALVVPMAPGATSTQFRLGGLVALILPRGAGAVALVGERGEPLRVLAKQLGLRPRADAEPPRP